MECLNVKNLIFYGRFRCNPFPITLLHSQCGVAALRLCRHEIHPNLCYLGWASLMDNKDGMVPAWLLRFLFGKVKSEECRVMDGIDVKPLKAHAHVNVIYWEEVDSADRKSVV